MKAPQLTSGRPAPEGTHTAVIYRLIDLGTHPVEFEGAVQCHPDGSTKTRRRIWIDWELPEELMDDGRPYSIGKEYSLVLGPKSALLPDMKSWLGIEIDHNFDFIALLGTSGNLTIIHKKKPDNSVRAQIASLGQLKKNERPPAAYNAQTIIDFQAGVFDEATYNALPEFLRSKIAKSPEYLEFIAKRNGGYSQQEDDGLPSHVTAPIRY